MNYLAHLYLSGSNEHVLVGNFIADSVKGSKHKDYPYDIQRGILLHTQGRSGMDKAIEELQQFYTEFESDFKLVFKDLKQMSRSFLEQG